MLLSTAWLLGELSGYDIVPSPTCLPTYWGHPPLSSFMDTFNLQTSHLQVCGWVLRGGEGEVCMYISGMLLRSTWANGHQPSPSATDMQLKIHSSVSPLPSLPPSAFHLHFHLLLIPWLWFRRIWIRLFSNAVKLNSYKRGMWCTEGWKMYKSTQALRVFLFDGIFFFPASWLKQLPVAVVFTLPEENFFMEMEKKE